MSSKSVARKSVTESAPYLLEIESADLLGQGQGATTEFKERCIQHALTVNLKICTQAAKYHSRYPYWQCDLHCASGWNDPVGCIGSPLAFLNAIQECGKENFHAFFCDKNKTAIEKLNTRQQVAENNRCYLFEGNNREVLPIFAEYIRRLDKPDYAMGSVICDPNGYLDENTVPINELRQFCRQHPRIDLIMNLNVRKLSLMRAHVEKGIGKWGTKHLLELDEIPAFFHRRYWLIRPVMQSKGDRFVLMIGRNFRYGDAKAFGFYHLDSTEGQTILQATKKQAA